MNFFTAKGFKKDSFNFAVMAQRIADVGGIFTTKMGNREFLIEVKFRNLSDLREIVDALDAELVISETTFSLEEEKDTPTSARDFFAKEFCGFSELIDSNMPASEYIKSFLNYIEFESEKVIFIHEAFVQAASCREFTYDDLATGVAAKLNNHKNNVKNLLKDEFDKWVKAHYPDIKKKYSRLSFTDLVKCYMDFFSKRG